MVSTHLAELGMLGAGEQASLGHCMGTAAAAAKSLQSCPALCDPMTTAHRPWDFPGKNTGVGQRACALGLPKEGHLCWPGKSFG